MSQVVEYLLCKQEALHSNPGPTKKKKKQKIRHLFYISSGVQQVVP
jgi:hypothetical protein